MTAGTCLVCGSVGTDVRMRLTHWANPVDGRRFDNVPRCGDDEACRRRTAQLGDAWPLAERAPKRRSAR